MVAEAIGYGAGTWNPERSPNVLPKPTIRRKYSTVDGPDRVTVLECAIDDATPQVLAYAMELALENKDARCDGRSRNHEEGRLGALLTVLAKPEDAAAIEALLFQEDDDTLGVRRRRTPSANGSLDRSFVTVETALNGSG